MFLNALYKCSHHQQLELLAPFLFPNFQIHVKAFRQIPIRTPTIQISGFYFFNSIPLSPKLLKSRSPMIRNVKILTLYCSVPIQFCSHNQSFSTFTYFVLLSTQYFLVFSTVLYNFSQILLFTIPSHKIWYHDKFKNFFKFSQKIISL